jgi:hypothetical protein
MLRPSARWTLGFPRRVATVRRTSTSTRPGRGVGPTSAFRLVDGDRAGPRAVGLLAPPGRRTLVIVRPRALPWDLLVVHSHPRTGPTTAFRDFGRAEAAAATEGLCRALDEWARGGPRPGRGSGRPSGEGRTP